MRSLLRSIFSRTPRPYARRKKSGEVEKNSNFSLGPWHFAACLAALAIPSKPPGRLLVSIRSRLVLEAEAGREAKLSAYQPPQPISKRIQEPPAWFGGPRFDRPPRWPWQFFRECERWRPCPSFDCGVAGSSKTQKPGR